MDKELTYNEALERVETIMSTVASGNLDIDKLSEKLCEAQALIDFCRRKLFIVDEEVKKLLADISDS